MVVSKGTVVSIDYTLKNDAGEVIDQSNPGQPLEYLQGSNNIIPGLENALEGRNVDESLSVRVSPEEGYGLSQPEMIQVVPRERFETDGATVEEGMQFHARTQQGIITVRVTKVEGDEVTIDGNHPLVDTPLNFDVTVKEIRLATEEELEHGHPHKEGGCCGGHGNGEDCEEHHQNGGGCGCH